ncbi:MAG: nucleotidyltransferase domain-containing protein [Clostridium sp.]
MEELRLDIIGKLNSEEFKAYVCSLEVNNVLLFGSTINGDFTEESDVDIAVLGTSKLSISEILRLELFLEDLLQRNIDVVDLNSETLDIFIKINILNTGMSIYTTDENQYLKIFMDNVDWYYKDNEYYFKCRRRDLLS